MPEVKGIVRISKQDIDGHKKLNEALKEIKGIGASLSHSITNIIAEETGIDKDSKIGSLKDDEIKKLKEIIKKPQEYNIPNYLLNRRKDRETGENKHLTEADLNLRKKRDIDFMKEIKSYKGIRHRYGLRVRGQKTKTTGRTGLELGVKAKKKKTQK